ncbi:MAG TPA: tRNA pseudouridine(55) synthase TruB, partial [bacterium]|nr:tRNA pseudouridine(55) synthase TruB [bacterium]
MDGVLLVDKPAGPTSQTVVTKVRRALGSDKAGHTGTLDPFATGLLVVCLGRATKLAGYLTTEDKSYRATVVLGAATDTDDSTGRELSSADASALTRERVEAALAAFRGPIRQTPPQFSAIQKDGERAY